MHHLDESAHHLLTRCKVGNHAIAQRTNRADVVVCLLIHHLSLLTHGNHLVRAAVKRYDRRLVHHNLIIADDDGVSGTEVHRYFLYE